MQSQSKQLVGVPDAVLDLFFLQAFHGPGDQQVQVGRHAADQALRPLRLEPLLDLAEDQLDRVQFALIRQVEHILDVELLHLGLRLLGPVHGQVVHKKTYFLIAISIPDHLKVLMKLFDIDGFVEDPELL